MENELYQYITTLTNKQLVKILEEPSDYTPEAVQVIRQILLTRNISAEEEQAIHKELLSDIFEEHQQKQQLEQKWRWWIAFNDIVKNPALLKEDKYFLLPLMALLTLYYVIFLYGRLNFLYFEIRNIQKIGLFFAAINILQLLSTPIVIGLLYKRQALGWTLATLGKTIELINILFFVFIYLDQYAYFNGWVKLEILLNILLFGGILVLLNLKKTKRIVAINASTQKQVIAAGIVAGMLYHYITQVLYRY